MGEARARKWNQMKRKSTLRLPPDRDSHDLKYCVSSDEEDYDRPLRWCRNLKQDASRYHVRKFIEVENEWWGIETVQVVNGIMRQGSPSGALFTWGKGDNHRLGHNSEEHVRHPKQVKGLAGKKVIQVGVGCMHVVVLTEESEVLVWGRNDQAQLGDAPHLALAEPTFMSSLHGKNIIGIACGPAQQRTRQYHSQLCMEAKYILHYYSREALVDDVHWKVFLLLGGAAHHPHLARFVPGKVNEQEEDVCHNT
ncbi:E3 ubiquitin-protein ligase HERC2 [Chionoecetes opilio]|uniref:E3 ubiquitin-protein ligase HERC2 n=1 Tax=Chionoecetes opilio TaxID=41210 RepID=A0A8J4XQK6_CHIOP|nr:E3 ubiquitin-protein ligase HERC2 [Chionoecetes opilio]